MTEDELAAMEAKAALAANLTDGLDYDDVCILVAEVRRLRAQEAGRTEAIRAMTHPGNTTANTIELSNRRWEEEVRRGPVA